VNLHSWTKESFDSTFYRSVVDISITQVLPPCPTAGSEIGVALSVEIRLVITSRSC
jgi:hypothetical protein